MRNYQDVCVIFFRKGKSYYFKFRGKIYKLDYKNIEVLKSHLIYPVKIRFCGFSRAQVGRVLSDLLNSEACCYFRKAIKTSVVNQYEAFLCYSSEEIVEEIEKDMSTNFRLVEK